MTMPRSGLDDDGRVPATTNVARRKSPGRTGASQRISSMLGDPRLAVSVFNPPKCDAAPAFGPRYLRYPTPAVAPAVAVIGWGCGIEPERRGADFHERIDALLGQ